MHISTKHVVNLKGKNRKDGIFNILEKRGKAVWPNQRATYKLSTVFNIIHSWFLSRILNEPDTLFP